MPEIRPARAEELDAVWALVCRAVKHMNAQGNPQWGSDYPTRSHYEEDFHRGELYVAAEGSAILGAGCINTQQAPEYGALSWEVPEPALVLHRLAVDPGAQCRGIGASFFRFAEELARRRRIPAFHIDTYAQNGRMQRLILSRGFHPVGQVHFDRVGRPQGFLCFEKVLQPG